MKRSLQACRPIGGFTLVELLSVVAIIAVLGGIVLAAVGKARSSARQTQCLANMREVSTALLLFSTENKGRFPAPYLGSAHGNKGPWSQQLVEAGLLPSPPNVLTCPIDETALAHTATAATATTEYNRKNTGRSYAYTIPSMQPVLGSANRHVPLVASTVKNPAATFMLVEFRQSTGQDYRWIAGSMAGVDLTNSNASLPHGGGMHFAFLDGHVAAFSREVASNPKRWTSQ